LASASGDGTTRVWDLAGDASPVVLEGHEKDVLYLAWSPDGMRLATTSGDGTVRVWDLAGDADPVVLEGHEKSVVHLAWSPDGVCLATASFDKTARVWDLATHSDPMVLSGHEHWVTNVAWTPDGMRLATATFDDNARIWDLSNADQDIFYKEIDISEFHSLYDKNLNSEQHKYNVLQRGVELRIDYKKSSFFFENSNKRGIVKSKNRLLWAGYSGTSVIVFQLENYKEYGGMNSDLQN
jgi:WD40 repeat protein